VLSFSLVLSFFILQCTSDLLPSYITGLSIFNREESRFKFLPGPIFNNVVLVDEINRAMPKTQSALLEAMEERRVTVEGVTHQLPQPFVVIATQNPVEQVGTYPLPESQLDRFLIRTGLGYPPEQLEKEIFKGGSIRGNIRNISPMISRDSILKAQEMVRKETHIADNVVGYLFNIVALTRSHPLILSGISTRGGINVADAAKAAAFLDGRNYVVPEDVKGLVVPVAAHRIILRAENEGLNKEEVLTSIVRNVPVPLV